MKRLVILLLLHCGFLARNTAQIPENLIQSMSVNKNNLRVRAHPKFKKDFLLDDFTVTYPKDVDLQRLPFSVISLPFLLNTISMVWVSGDVYFIQEMDRDLFRTLKIVKEVFKRLYPRASFEGEVIPQRLVKNNFFSQYRLNPWKDYIMHFFTGGLDSTYSSLCHEHDKQLLVTVFTTKQKSRFVKDIKRQVQNFAHKHDHACASISSNYEHFLNREVLHHISPDIKHWRLEAVEGLGWIGLAVPLMVAYGITSLRIAGSLAWSCPWHHAPIPHVDENVAIGNLTFFHDGFDASRINKCEYLSEYCARHHGYFPFLRVCKLRQRGTNCSRCEKCLRTIANLRAVGLDHSKFGFTGAPEEFFCRAQQMYPEMILTRYNLWHYLCTQKKLRERKKSGHFGFDPFLKYFEQFDFQALNRDKNAGMYEVNWSDFTDLLPKQRR